MFIHDRIPMHNRKTPGGSYHQISVVRNSIYQPMVNSGLSSSISDTFDKSFMQTTTHAGCATVNHLNNLYSEVTKYSITSIRLRPKTWMCFICMYFVRNRILSSEVPYWDEWNAYFSTAAINGYSVYKGMATTGLVNNMWRKYYMIMYKDA